MSAKSFSSLFKALGPAFNRAAPESIRWGSEAAFFEHAIRSCKAKINGVDYPVLMQGIEAGNEVTIGACAAAARQVAAMGLSMNPTAKLVYFVPRRARERRDGEPASEYATVPWVVDPTPSYMGLAYIATHYASARVFGACEVYKADKFRLLGPFAIPLHEPTVDPSQRDEKLALGVYAAVRLQGGDERCEYVDAPTVQRIRGLSKLQNSLMYTKVWTEGWKKIATRRLCKLVMQAEPRMLAAESAMQRHEGFTFNAEGELEEVPRGTPGSTKAPEKREKSRGMNGLKARMDASREGDAVEQPEEPLEPEAPAILALPAPSTHPEGSIEWWLGQIDAADDVERMETIKIAALKRKLDQSEDADAFRDRFSLRMRELKGRRA